ncbi:MAG TPA: hypothetical protein VFY84_02215 [Jiangellales bacterium]|nr:hypothetical protein [Jiangellales bacterium]
MSSTSHPVRRRRSAAALGLGLLTSLVGAALPATPAAAAPSRADLVVTATATRADVVDVGGGATVVVDVRNAGTRAAQDVTVTYAMPPGADFTDGNSPPEGWQCDFRGARTCTYGALAAGASAPPLQFDFYFPPAPAGTTAALTVTATTSSNERSTADNTAQATINYIRGVTDIEVTQVQASPSQAVIGDTVNMSVEVRNSGNMTAEEVYVTVPVPAGFTRQSEDTSTGWDCAFGDDPATGQPAWRCTRYGIVSGWTADPLNLTATVTSGTPGDVPTVTATATTNSPEDDLSDNSGQASVAIVQPATVRGTVWLDADRDGVRDAGELGVKNAGLQVSVRSDPEGQPGAAASVAPDGTYTTQFRPGGVVVDFSIAKPYCFTDSADADLAGYDNSSLYSNQAWSNPATVTAGGEVVIDAAVVTC